MQLKYQSVKRVKVNDSKLTKWFIIKTGVRQRCVMSPQFNVFIDGLLGESVLEKGLNLVKENDMDVAG